MAVRENTKHGKLNFELTNEFFVRLLSLQNNDSEQMKY